MIPLCFISNSNDRVYVSTYCCFVEICLFLSSKSAMTFSKSDIFLCRSSLVLLRFVISSRRGSIFYNTSSLVCLRCSSFSFCYCAIWSWFSTSFYLSLCRVTVYSFKYSILESCSPRTSLWLAVSTWLSISVSHLSQTLYSFESLWDKTRLWFEQILQIDFPHRLQCLTGLFLRRRFDLNSLSQSRQ